MSAADADDAVKPAAPRASLFGGRKWVLLGTFAVTFALAVMMLGAVHESHVSTQRLATQMLAQGYAQRIQERLQTALVSTYVLASIVKQSHGRVAHFDDVAGELITLFPGVSAMQLAPNGVIEDVYPRAGNEAAIGHDLLGDRKRNREAVAAITTQQLTLAGPFKLIQGGIGAAGRMPVFLTNDRHERHFWGFAIALIRIPSLLDAAGVSDLAKSGYRFQLWRLLPDTEERDVFARSDNRPLTAPVEYVITVYNGRWFLSLEPQEGWLTTTDYVEIFGYALAVALVVTLLQYLALRALMAPRE